MEYKETPQSGNSYLHVWDVASARVFDGGFLFDKTTVPDGTETLPKGVFLKVDQVERKATLIKTAVLFEAITNVSTTVKIKKGSLLLATDIVGINGAAVLVGTIDTSNADYDSFDIVADSLGALAEGAVLQTYDEAGSSNKNAVNPDGINPVDVTLDAEPSCSAIYAVDGIVTERLPHEPTDAIKTALKFCQFLS